MVTAVAEKQEIKEIKSLHESIFWEEEDPKLRMTNWKGGVSQTSPLASGAQFTDLLNDAYIWCFTGSRGSGKSMSMTYYAAKAVYLWNMRIVSNYPIEFILNRIDGTHQYVKSEPLDLYKLLCFDKDYHHCLILMDEAPDIISHMAAMTWKNRLLNIFVRQLRKNMNSLFLGAQQFTLIDKSMRWQTDVVVKCQDAFRLYGASGGLVRGACVLVDMFDNSGQWTGHGKNINYDGEMEYLDPDESIELAAKPLWGVYNTYFQQDVFESLKRVDMNLGSYEVGAPKEDNSEYRQTAYDTVTAICNDGGKVFSPEFYSSLGNAKDSDVKELGSALRACGIRKGGHGKETLIFDGFNLEKFKKVYLEKI